MSSIAERIYFQSPVWLQNILVSAYGYRLYRKRYGGAFKQILNEVRSIDEMNTDQIEALQAERLNRMIAYCEQNIPYYQKLLSERSLTSQDFTQTSDIKKLPVLEKSTVKDHPELFQPRRGSKPWMVQQTSGSTGSPLILNVDEYTYKLAMALLVRHEENAGVPFGSRKATFAGRLIQPVNNVIPPFSRFNKAENQRLFSSYHLNEHTFPHYKRELDHFQPLEIIGYPSAISDLASYYEQTGYTPSFTPRAIITNSETLLDWQREKIERVFNCRIFDYYGTAEYVTFAGQDNTGMYRVNPLIGLTEFLENERREPGTKNIVTTTLCNTAMPLIRYSIGDMAQTRLEHGFCPP
ncbi:phenylacetate--CoA ligase family protein, partial [Tamilnaduibacter salinus]